MADYFVVKDSGELPITRKTLRFRSSGSDVKDLQTALNRGGQSLNIDGLFGKLTEAALKRYQAENGLIADGICWPKTWAKIDSKDGVGK